MNLIKSKILFVVSEDWYFRSHRLDLAKYAIKKGYRVALLTNFSKYKNEILDAGIEAYDWDLDRSTKNIFSNLRSGFTFFKVLRNYKPNIIHSVAIKPIIISFLFGNIIGYKKYVFALGGLGTLFSEKNKYTILNKIIRTLIKISFSNFRTKIIIQNQHDYNLLLGQNLAKRNQLCLIKSAGVNINKFSYSKIDHSKKSVLLSSRLLWTKGVDDFIKMSNIVHNTRKDIKFVLIGNPDEKNPDSVPLSFLKTLQNKKHIEWLGHSDNVAKVIKLNTIVCLPSVYGEGIPKALVEASSCGRPIIAYDVPGCDEIVINGVNGYLIPPKNIDMLAEKLLFLIENESLCENFGLRGRKFVVENFRSELISNQTEKVWMSCIN